MSRDRFLQRKIAVLSKLDKSSIGGWDKRIKKLCDKINKLPDFYTTSSCSGRVILMIQQDKKGEDLFLKVWHDKVSVNKLKKALEDLVESKDKRIIKFKLEPPIVHIACRDLKKATWILEKAKYIGFKRSSILTFDKNIIVELNTNERLEFPIIKDSKLLVDESFLKLVLEVSHQKMGKWWEKIQKLERSF
ncbi:MAG: tRNA wybutosine-synthesizing 3 family protein [Nanobdellota archaeon]